MSVAPASLMRVGARTLDQLSIYLPVILMGLLALGSYWLVRNTPLLAPGGADRPAAHEPDYFMRRFSVKTFDAGGSLRSEVFGEEVRHYPDTDTLEIDKPRLRSLGAQGGLTVASAERAISNGDGSEVQLIGNAVVVREGVPDASGRPAVPLEFRGEFLHVFVNTERIRSHRPVTLTRGTDRFSADSLDYDNLDRVMLLRGRVHGMLAPRSARTGG